MDEPRTITVTVSAARAGERLDRLVLDAVPGLGRKGARRLFEEGRVLVGRRRAAKGEPAREGDVLTIALAAEPGAGVTPEPDATLAVVFENEHVVVVDKPAGMPTAPLRAGERGTLAGPLIAHFPELAQVGHSPLEPGLLHRLDNGTSGLVVAARTAAAFQALSAGLRAGRFDKRYLLVCPRGELAERGIIALPLAPHPKDARRVLACLDPRDVARHAPRPAETAFAVLRHAGRWALVEARVAKAGRHQLRAHFAAIGHPLAGDVLYGGEVVPGLTRQALHASYIAWPGDASVPAFEARSRLPAELERVLAGG